MLMIVDLAATSTILHILFSKIVDEKTSTNKLKRSIPELNIKELHSQQARDLEVSDDLAVPLYTQQQMKQIPTSIAARSTAAALNIHKGSIKILRTAKCAKQITLDGFALNDVNTLTYLVNIIIV
ncbi:unnamed protein product [Schistosoma turkestanicum]|nr:unnamed protein product [Schistosoma turkestanicum]